MKRKNPMKPFLRWWRSIHPVDRLLLLFMLILLAQSAHVLFFPAPARQSAEALDVMVRTTASAIGGYFISTGFCAPAEAGRRKNGCDPEKPMPEELPAQSECSVCGSADTPSDKNRPIPGCLLRQFTVVGIIGILSLIMLVLARDYAPFLSKSAATVSQLRDFVSGSVGFLIGHVGRRKNT